MRICSTVLACVLLLAASLGRAEDAAVPDIAYFDLKPSLVTNLNGGPRYIRCEVQLMVTDPDRLPEVELHAAALRNEMLLLLAEQDGSKLTTLAGKENLRLKVRDAFRKVLKNKIGVELVRDVFFTSYYVE